MKGFANRRHPENKAPLLGAHLLATWADPDTLKRCCEVAGETENIQVVVERGGAEAELGFGEAEITGELEEEMELALDLQQLLGDHSPVHDGGGSFGWADPEYF